tara:strand:- start:7756 stop:7914 length:159 start_codon:yes stop_codon:yes gene_type:complete
VFVKGAELFKVVGWGRRAEPCLQGSAVVVLKLLKCALVEYAPVLFLLKQKPP